MLETMATLDGSASLLSEEWAVEVTLLRAYGWPFSQRQVELGQGGARAESVSAGWQGRASG